MNGNSPGNRGFDRRTLLTSGVLAGLSVTAIGMAGTAQAVTRRPVRKIAGRKVLTPDDVMATLQSPWKFCDKCKILYWGPEQTSSVCQAGGTHGGNSSNYTVFLNPIGTPDPGEQVGWAFCDKCKGMYYGLEQTSSVCPAGGTHGGPSGNYMMLVGNFTATGFSSQFNWQFCDKCKGMYYGPERTSSVCPDGGIHGGNTSEYTMLFT